MQRHARSCNVMQGRATSCKVVQHHARSCKVMQGKSHTSLVNFTLLSRHFTCFQAFSDCWRKVVVYHRWSLVFKLVFLCCFFWKKSLFTGHFQNPIPSSVSFVQLGNVKGAQSKDSDQGHLVLMIGLSQSSGSLFISDNLRLPCGSS